ncbi:MAG: HAMP domain-containing protein [Chloroflexi bacterium]|nr:HAMP domain-containing protein [Chloroflexota bacterium]
MKRFRVRLRHLFPGTTVNRLWVRLSLAFGAVVFVSFAAIALVSAVIIRANVAEFDSTRQVGEIDAVAPDTITSTKGYLPVVVNGETVAYLDMTLNANRPHPARPLPFFNWDALLLTVVVVGGSVAILCAVLMSRSVIAPLNALAVTADAIGAGQWDRRVKVTGTTEIKSLAQSFNKMVDQLQRNETLRRNLVADVAHELRTPITALQANIYAILDDAYPMTKIEIAGLYDQIRMLSRLVKDLHELSQAESGLLPLDRQPTDFSETLAELIAPFRSVAESKEVRLALDIPANLPLVSVDEERINQVMHNLLNNALRYTPEEGTITIRVRSSGECLRVEVQDTGDGIPAEHLPNVFERFYRADFGRSRQRGGMGLGLAIAKAIIEAHNGSIRVSSSGVPGEGTTFVFEIPVIATDVHPQMSEAKIQA